MNDAPSNGFGLPLAVPAAAPVAQPIAPPVVAQQVVAPAVAVAPVAARPVAVPPPSAAAPLAAPAGAARGLVLDELLIHALSVGASDLHLTQNAPPTVRVRGEMEVIEGFEPLSATQLQTTLYGVMTERQRKVFEEEHELDFAYAVPGHARFRVNVFRQREAVGAVMRAIPWEIVPLEKLGMPDVISGFAGLKRGLVLVTGPTGSGKSTTLAAIIDKINRSRRGHIMTIEDPIEFLHEHRGCLVNQREVGADTKDFAVALKHVLRQDPDVILVGELRDLETISVALTAAETGHLVFATLHTQSAQDTITRVVDVFPAEQQQQVRTQLAASLQAVVCQTLMKTTDGKGRAAGVEIMVCNSGIRAMIRDNKLQQIQGALQAGARDGMQTLNAHLAALVREGRVTYEAALEACTNRTDFDSLVGSSTARTTTAGWQ
ncbi:type IV pilus twitching motility protein PilT [Nocardioides pacificus]